MLPFLHQRLQGLEPLLQSADDALRATSDSSPALVDLVLAHLDAAGAVYAELSVPDARNLVVELAAQMAAARDGINPLTHERVATRRREMQRTVALHLVQASSERLRTDYADVSRSLTALRERLTPLALYAVQEGLVPPTPDGDLPQAELEAVWQALLQDPQSRGAARQVAATATFPDILITLGDLLDSVL